MNNIDFVIPWVDPNDFKWQEDFKKYKYKHDIASDPRFREWDNLKYWFRSIEKNANWVNKIHFITCGHLPSWLNKNNPKLNIVYHHDYIPDIYLPTFSSHVIEINIAKIKGLSEKFVYFNDDTFVINKITPNFYFRNNLPCDAYIANVITPDGDYSKYLANNLEIICSHYNKNNFYKKQYKKIFNFKYGKFNLNNLILFPWSKFTGFKNFHLPQPFMKKTFLEIYRHEDRNIHNTCKNKFRSITDINQYLFRDWQLVTGQFAPKDIHNTGITVSPNINNLNHIINSINNKKIKCICINDSAIVDQFEYIKETINSELNNLFPEKSTFEM